MKPLLRVVLVIDALLLLAFGLLFLLTPWTSLYNALQLEQVQPALVGQAFGIALLGLAWLALHAAVDGAMTRAVARAVGHVDWLTGVLMLVWVVALHRPSLTGFGQLVGALVAVVLIILGLGSVRLAAAVRRREKAQAAGAVAEKKQIEKKAAKVREVEAFPVAPAEPVMPDSRPVSAATGRPVEPDFTAAHQPGVVTAETRTVQTHTTQVSREAVPDPARNPARDAARDAAADSPGAPRPPFHG
ncbi:MAG: hypothetical protein JO371_08430 [Paraburkholderia sp.]|nr:hypothetical protein [Paraburkholderia sp.]